MDGELKDTNVWSGNLDTSTSNEVNIGSYDTSRYWNGSIDEVKIYSRALSESEIQDLYRVSDFTSPGSDNYGSGFRVDNTNSSGGEFDQHYLQYKINSLSGDFGPPAVEKAEVAKTSGWTGFSSDSNSNGLSLNEEEYGRVQFNLSSSAPENSSEVEDVKLWTEKTGDDFICSAPGDGDWVIDRNCTIDSEQDVPGNVEVREKSTVNVTEDGSINVDLKNDYLLVRKLSKLLVDAKASVS